MSKSLYQNSKGFDVKRFSYSAGSDFQFCPKKFDLRRRKGWVEKDQYARLKFGIAMEEAVRTYHEMDHDLELALFTFLNGPKGDTQNKGWFKYRYDQSLQYTKTEVDWDSLNKSGQEMLKLYHLRLPLFRYKVSNPKDSFQIYHSIEVFPNSNLSGIEFIAYLDLVAELNFAPYEKILIDIKAAGTELPDLIMLDPQLRAYAWAAGIKNVGFLWFQKMSRGFKSGSECTVLEPSGSFFAGQQAFVLKSVEPDPKNFKTDDGLYIVDSEKVVEEYSNIEGKGEKAAKAEFIINRGHYVKKSQVTKQRVQFAFEKISKDSQIEAGEAIGRDIVNIVKASEDNFFPMTGGIRFPVEKCPMCSMRGICSGNNALRDALLVREQGKEFDISMEE